MADLSLPKTIDPPIWLTGETADQIAERLHQALNSSAHRERWKYTKAEGILADVAAPSIAPFLDGTEQAGLEITLGPLDNALPGIDFQQAPEASARLCYAAQAVIIDVTQHVQGPFRIHHGDSTLPVIIRLAPNSALTLLEVADGSNAMQQSIWIDLGENAQLHHSRNALNPCENHWQYLNVRLQQGANYHLNNHVAGSKLRRQDIQLVLDGQGSEATLVSAGRVRHKDALDQQITVEHRQPRGSSKQTVHNIVADGGKCTFNGRIHIHEGASGTDAQLSNKNLGMGDHATINTKPELEIYTDDVSCSHGATVGTISQEALFYLMSRGVALDTAEALLSQGFLRQCINGPLAEEALLALVGEAVAL
jgi:Fe-S cluster assembly protein SufD